MTNNALAFVAFLFVFLALTFAGSARAQVQSQSCEVMAADTVSYEGFSYGPRNADPSYDCAYEGDLCTVYWDGVNGGAAPCVLDGPPAPASCEDRAGQIFSSGLYNMGLSPDNDPARFACDDGCQTIYSGFGIAFRTMINGFYNYGAEGEYTFTGAECSASENPSVGSAPTPPDTVCNPDTQVEGVIDGKTICFTKGSTTTQTDTTIDPVTGDRTETTTTTNPDGSSTTKTTVKTTDPNTGATSETSTKTSNPASPDGYNPDAFCLSYPDDPTCKADAAGPVGSGAEGECALNPNTLGCARIDGPIDGVDLQTEIREIGLITPIVLGNGGECPAPLSASFLGQQLQISFDPLCQFANSLRPVVLVLAWLAAGWIFIGGVRS